MYTVNLEIGALILSLVCLSYSLTVKRRQYTFHGNLAVMIQNQHFVFLLLLANNLLSAAASVGGVYLQEIASERMVFWQYLLHAIYFFFHSSLSVCFALYIMNVNGTTLGRRWRFYLPFSLPYLLAEALILTNSFTGLAFYMDDAFIYHRGALMPALYAVGALYIILGLVFFIRYNKAVSDADRKAIAAVIVMSSLGIVVQALRSDLLVELFAEAVAFLMLMVMLEERSGHIDLATGALNRVAFADANRRLMQANQRYGIVLLRLTNLEQYSKLFSGREMEKLLMQISAWLTNASSAQDLFCCGQGEFAVMVTDLDAEPEKLEAMTQKILDRFGWDWRSGDMTLRLEATVAPVRVPEDLSTLDELEELLASGFQKSETGSRLVKHSELSDIQHSRSIEHALRRALDNRALRVWYQPVWSVEGRRTIAAEALLRIDDEAFRGVSPEVYIPVAEKCGLIREIGLFVFEDVCRFLQEHGGEMPNIQYIELNLSVYQFLYDDLAERFEEIRNRYRVERSRLNIEITESASDQAAAGVGETMGRLRGMGYTFSLDDFGTGYANLSRLITGDYLNVKIDKSLLWDSDENPDTRRLLENLTHVIRSLGYNVIQEGVETLSQLTRVADAGCNLIQGYFFSRPLPEEDFLRYLAAERAGTAKR